MKKLIKLASVVIVLGIMAIPTHSSFAVRGFFYR